MLTGREMARSLRIRADYLHGREMSDTADLCVDAAVEIERLLDVIRTRDKHIDELQGQLIPIYDHWNEFGPEHGFGELMDRLQDPHPQKPPLGTKDRVRWERQNGTQSDWETAERAFNARIAEEYEP